MSTKKFLLSKDVFGKFYLPTYGNKYWKTPNIDELAQKGTIFDRHYCVAPSSNMSYYGMFTGQLPMESNIKAYHILSNDEKYTGDTLFDKANSLGYECHIIWDSTWADDMGFAECFGKNTVFHNLEGIRQPTGLHVITGKKIKASEEKVEEVKSKIEKCISSICNSDKDIFIWMHLPHVWGGRTCYGSDIDIVDWCVGMIRKYISDDEIYITADHGNMNGSHGKLGYGFDVYESAACIPLITPRIDTMEHISFPTSNADLFSIIFEKKIPKRDFVFCDSAYYTQLHRKLAIIHGNFKYIYSASGKKEELFDVLYDPNENQNLIDDFEKDIDRGVTASINELYFYPDWNAVYREREILRKKCSEVWKNPSTKEYLQALYVKYGKRIKRKINRIKYIIQVRFLKQDYKKSKVNI